MSINQEIILQCSLGFARSWEGIKFLISKMCLIDVDNTDSQITVSNEFLSYQNSGKPESGTEP